jgi:hypothetical protein
MRISSFVPATVLALALAGCSASDSSPNSDPTPRTTTDPATTAPASDPSPLPDNPVEDTSLDFAELTRVTTANGVVTLHVDRKKMYVGDEAAALNKETGSPAEFAIDDPDGEGKELTFVLAPDAFLRADQALSDDEDQNVRQALTAAQFLRNAQRLESEKRTALVWLRHTDGLNGPVTGLAEQFIP